MYVFIKCAADVVFCVVKNNNHIQNENFDENFKDSIVRYLPNMILQYLRTSIFIVCPPLHGGSSQIQSGRELRATKTLERNLEGTRLGKDSHTKISFVKS